MMYGCIASRLQDTGAVTEVVVAVMGAVVVTGAIRAAVAGEVPAGRDRSLYCPASL